MAGNEVIGVRELVIKLNKLKGLASKEQKTKALMQGGLLVEREAKERCPVDTGVLRASIKAEPVDDGAVIIAPHTDYAAFPEFGTVYQAAQPYMRPAYDENVPQIRGSIIAELIRLIKAAAG